MDHSARADDMRPFRLLDSTKRTPGPRLGKLKLPRRQSIETPHYLAVTSRGVIPHLTQDNFKRHSSIRAAYLGLEDCKCLQAASGGMDHADELPLTEAFQS